MSAVEGDFPSACPVCGNLFFQDGWDCISVESQNPEDRNYSKPKGIIRGHSGMDAGAVSSQSKGSLKSESIDIYQCPECGKTVQRTVKIYW